MRTGLITGLFALPLVLVVSHCMATVFLQDSTEFVKLSPCSFSYKSPADQRRKAYFIDLAPVAVSSGAPRFFLDLHGFSIAYNPCFDFSIPCCGKVAVCEIQKEGNSSGCTDRGNQDSVSIMSRPNGMFSLEYSSASNHLSAIVDLICTRDTMPALAIISEHANESKQLHLALMGNISCPLVVDGFEYAVKPHLSVGSVILIIAFSLLTVYFLGGMLIKRLIGGARGVEVVPNHEFWLDLPVLIKDGAWYLVNGCRPEVVYEQI
ncbi:uncharacterized protein LOC129598683 [Paramacrobiotus metropolitanus]|uniref:uncharacterized protein LOC129598683 n=1 Tax=Paramacrobiotus metropolitanus TaxID=2943436 RepID=UPI0024458AE6|nr:uncharacterized protein LOC129598683 [Paramacrobiotus metropolitanus]